MDDKNIHEHAGGRKEFTSGHDESPGQPGGKPNTVFLRDPGPGNDNIDSSWGANRAIQVYVPKARKERNPLMIIIERSDGGRDIRVLDVETHQLESDGPFVELINPRTTEGPWTLGSIPGQATVRVVDLPKPGTGQKIRETQTLVVIIV